MKNIQIITIVVFSAVAQMSALAEDKKSSQLPPKETFHLFLLAGQSNMAGRGKTEDVDRKAHPRILALGKDGKWKPATAPIHFDKGAAGVGLSKSFALALVDTNKDIVVGLIPAACGGSPISTWQPGKRHGQTRSNPYDDAIKRASLAMKVGTLKGILWHQGESDCNPARSAEHNEKLKALIARFRKDLKTPAVPFVIGQLGQFPSRPWNDDKKTVNAAHVAVADGNPHVAFVSSQGLTCKSDKVHFNAKSLRTFGKRYAEAYLKLIKSK